MSNSMRDLISGEAELDDEEDDGSYDEETGEERVRRNGAHIDDSSEEEDDDDDEEGSSEGEYFWRGVYHCMLTRTSAQIREGFIVDEEEEEEEEVDSDAEPRPVKRKREHRDREEEERLDEDDLELIGEQFGERPKPESKSKFKRLKRGHRDEDDVPNERRGLDEIFSDEDEDATRTKAIWAVKSACPGR
ncbi:Transcription elongation factor spt6 [Metarhizium acridum]|nr:Transcription elongation factor spt6 [Metarhizium acridum]